MFSLRSLVFAAISFAVLFSLAIGPVPLLLRTWWRSRVVRASAWIAIGVTALGLAAWAAGRGLHARGVMRAGIDVSWTMLAFVLPLAVVVPLTALAARAVQAIAARRKKSAAEGVPDDARLVRRRDVIQWSAASVPLATMTASGVGLASAAREPLLTEVPMRIAGLPRALERLRILQLTDLHLGPYRTLKDLDFVLGEIAARGAPPDLIAITGDIADDLTVLLPALRAVAALSPRLGVFACPGNHEYFHRIGDVMRIFDKSPVPLLMDQGTSIAVDDAVLRVSGVTDPVRLHGDVTQMHRASLDRALDGAPSDATHLLLCHRPSGFVPASERGIALQLSGHTHGGQVGLFGRSVFEPLLRDRYLRGPYERGASRLYTSAGFGHWFPFRLNCDAEAPTLILERA